MLSKIYNMRLIDVLYFSQKQPPRKVKLLSYHRVRGLYFLAVFLRRQKRP